MVQPYVYKILVVIESFLMDEDCYALMDGHEIISNLEKVAGLALQYTWILTMLKRMFTTLQLMPSPSSPLCSVSLHFPLKAVYHSKNS